MSRGRGSAGRGAGGRRRGERHKKERKTPPPADAKKPRGPRDRPGRRAWFSDRPPED